MPTRQPTPHGIYTYEYDRISNKMLFINSYKTIRIEHVYSVRHMECEHRGGMTNNGTISMAAYHLEAAEGTVGLRLRFRATGLDEPVVPALVGALAARVIRALTSLRVRTNNAMDVYIPTEQSHMATRN